MSSDRMSRSRVPDPAGESPAREPGGKKPHVLLLSMPWATTTRPSIALAILTRICRCEDASVSCFYPNLDLNAEIGFEAAARLANERSLYGLSEHLFAVDLFGREALDSEEYIEIVSGLGLPEPYDDGGFIRRLRDEVIPAFLDRLTERIVAAAPDVVGVTATFNQVLSSLALASRLKARLPEVRIIAGGACFDGEMGLEYQRALPHLLDHVFIGEAESSFREYLRRLREGRDTSGIPGVTSVAGGRLSFAPGSPLGDLNDSPMPDYDAFFHERERVRQATGRIFNIESLPFEGSRGCWWGSRSQCVFCGLNPDALAFREKGVDRVIQEIVALSRRYRVVKLAATDWIISRPQRARIFEELVELDLDLELFYETRADLTKGEVERMKAAGVTRIQPGIESLSTPLLKAMGKGTTAIRHLQFLRWCREYGVRVSYNILGGFPGEKAEWYREMTRLISRIGHLQPPLHNLHFVELHRFSPLFEQAAEMGVDEYRLRADYRFNFPEGLVDPMKVGYFFSFRSETLADPEEYAQEVREAIEPWIEAHEGNSPPVYEYFIGPEFLHIVDTRHGEGRIVDLAGLHQDVLLLCDQIQSRRKLAGALAPRYPDEIADDTLDRVIDELLERDLLYAEGHQLLALPTGHKPRTTEALRSYVLGAAAEPALAVAHG